MHENRIYILKVEKSASQICQMLTNQGVWVLSEGVELFWAVAQSLGGLLPLCTLVATYNIGVLMTHSVSVRPSHTGFKTFTFLVSLKRGSDVDDRSPGGTFSEHRTTNAVKGKIHTKCCRCCFLIYFPINPQNRGLNLQPISWTGASSQSWQMIGCENSWGDVLAYFLHHLATEKLSSWISSCVIWSIMF